MNVAGIDLNLLVALDAMLEERSVTRAARRLGRSQPAMSHALTRLRHELDDPLLVRQGHAMVPTPRAAAMAPKLRRVLEDLGRLMADAGDFDPATSTRRFVLVCPDMLAALVPDLLSTLADAPGVELELRDAAVPDADVTLGVLPEAAPGVVARRLGRVYQRVALRPGHPALAGAWDSDVYLRWPHILVRTGTPGTSLVERAIAAAGGERRVGFVASGFLMAAHVAARTDMLFTAPGALLSRMDLALELRDPPLSIPAVPVAAMWSERLSSDPGHRWFRDRVVEVVSAAMRGSSEP